MRLFFFIDKSHILLRIQSHAFALSYLKEFCRNIKHPQKLFSITTLSFPYNTLKDMKFLYLKLELLKCSILHSIIRRIPFHELYPV